DLGRALGPGAHVTALRRTRSGPFTLGAARPLGELLEALQGQAGSLSLVRLEEALGHLPRCFVDEPLPLAISPGQPISRASLVGPSGRDDLDQRICVLRRDGGLVAVAERRGSDGVHTLRVFATT